MKFLWMIVLTASLSAAACAPEAKIAEPNMPEASMAAPAKMSDLLGRWDVSLYFSPDQPPSATVLNITSADAGALKGQFYGTDFEFARAAEFENIIRLSFVTSDSSGAYTSSARLLPDGTLSGQTLSTGRDFLMPWTAEKT